MHVPDIIIAIDGHSSTGKSSFAKLIASEFGFLYLDSGAMYRGVTLYAMENGFLSKEGAMDTASLKTVLQNLDLSLKNTGTYIGERCVENEIRSLAVSRQVSPVSALPFVRDFVDRRLREMAAGGRVVMDGRDIGTTVFPKAEVKIFMTAEVQIRAQRRFDEMVAKGQQPDFEEVLKNIEDRDYMDSHRAVSPLTRAPDAFVLDNSRMTLHEEAVWIRGLIQGKFNIKE